MKTIVLSVLVFLSSAVLPHPVWSQSAACSFWSDADFWEYSYEICAATDQATEFRIDISQTIFNDAHSFTQTVSPPFCQVVTPLNVYPADTYGRQAVTLTITTTADPAVILAQCSHELIHARAATVELVLDKSGSMAAQNKLQTAVTAASAFIDSIYPLVMVRPGMLQWQHYGVVPYSTTAAFLDTEPLVAGMGDVDYETPTDATNAKVVEWLQRLSAGGTTSIGDGLRVARGALEANISPEQDAFQRPAILVLSDGMENTPPMIASQTPDLIAKNIPVYTIGFGEDYLIDAAKLSDLSGVTGGRYRHTTDPDDISKFFLEVLVDNYANTHIVVDPKGALTGGQSAVHEFPVSSLEKGIVVVLTWRDPARKLGMELKTPNLTISDGNKPSGVNIVDRGAGYKIFGVAVCQGSTSKNCSQPGAWTLTISAPAGVSEHYSFTVLSNSDAALGVSVPRGPVLLGERLPIAAQLMLENQPIENASATFTAVVPQENVFDRIARASIDTGSAGKLPSDIDTPSLLAGKARAVYGGKPVPRTITELSARKKGPGPAWGPGLLEGTLEKTPFPGSYTVAVRMEAKDGKGYTIRREATRSVLVAAQPTAQSRVNISVLRESRKMGMRLIRVDFTPLDRDGRLLGLGLADQINLSGLEGRAGSFRDLGNGTYRLEVEIPRRWNSLRLAMAGKAWEVNVPTGK